MKEFFKIYIHICVLVFYECLGNYRELTLKPQGAEGLERGAVITETFKNHPSRRGRRLDGA